MTHTTREQIEIRNLQDTLLACRKSLTICAKTKEVKEWVDTKIQIKQTQKQLKELMAKGQFTKWHKGG